MYRDYTGVSAKRWADRSSLDLAHPISSAPSSDHELLESMVLAGLGRGGYFTGADPFGIRSVHPTEDGSLVVRLVDTVVGLRERRIPFIDIVASHLLPYGETVSWNGIENLRIAHISDRELIVALAGTQARLILRGGANTNWRKAVERRAREIIEYEPGAHPMWNDPHPEHDEFPALTRGHREMAWLGSGLLRRVGLFRSTTNAFNVSGWCCDQQFKFVFDFAPRAWNGHDGFESAICDPIWGLGLEPQTRSCRCERMPDRFHQCMVVLTHPSGRIGGLQLRFGCTAPPEDIDAMWTALGGEHIREQWLRRTLPA